MATLTGRQIRQMVERGELEIKPFEPSLVEPASYDLRLHEKLLASPLGPNDHGEIRVLSQTSPVYAVQPGQMVGAMSLETIAMPLTLSGRFGIRSEFTRRGLIAFGGLQLDPGWRGRLVMSLLNVGPEPLVLHWHEPFFSIELSRLEEAAEPYEGRYQEQLDFPQDQADEILSARTTSFAEIPLFRSQINQLNTLMEDLLDQLSDPDAELSVSKSVLDRLNASLQRSNDEFVSHEEIWTKLGM